MITCRKATWLSMLLFPLACGITVGHDWNRLPSASSRRHVCSACPARRDVAPPGSSLQAMRAIQIANGQATKQTLYHYDFVRGSDRLTPRGHFQLEKILRRLVESPYPVIIETTGSAELDEARRARVLDALEELNFPDLQVRVVIGPPPTRPLDGVDAMALHQRLLGLSSGASSAPAVAAPSAVAVPVTP